MFKKIKRFHSFLKDYDSDSSMDIKSKTFVLFSSVMLAALYLAIPAGLIMREPLSATIATIVGAILFTIYVVYVFKKKHVKFARVLISVIVIFVFLPVMFFSNGGAEGGTPIWLLLGTLYIAMILEGKFKFIMLALEALVLTACWVAGYYKPDLVTEYSRAGNYFDSIAGLFIVGFVLYVIITFYVNILKKEEQNKNSKMLFEQTAMALVGAIEAKDKYTHGHSSRVAQYSRMIAEKAGKSPKECEEIYYAALLHDVGKIGIPENIINKDSKLTDEEYAIIKQHPILGDQILQRITEFPYISLGAYFHHERYDGQGYPMGLKGTDIPEIARIMAVADSYDAMTSKRSYRDALPQEKVREELIEGSGTQFDPKFADIMQHLIDLDTEYEMKERGISEEQTEVIAGKHLENVYKGILINRAPVVIHCRVGPDKKNTARMPVPSMIIFDSLDGRYHDKEDKIKAFLYYKYCEIEFNGKVDSSGVRKIEVSSLKKDADSPASDEYIIKAVKIKDHIQIDVINAKDSHRIIAALPDSTRYAYIGLTGKYCRISNISTERSEKEVEPNYIQRIAEKISFINVPAGDIPNVQVDEYRSESTTGIPITDGMKISFHTKSLPTARLVWHCPSYVIFSSDDGNVSGTNYNEFSLVRLDGEYWKGKDIAENELIVKRHGFNGWDSWKDYNKKGYDCTISFERNGNRIISYTENAGISIKNVTQITIETKEVYVALSGDQVVLTGIKIIY